MVQMFTQQDIFHIILLKTNILRFVGRTSSNYYYNWLDTASTHDQQWHAHTDHICCPVLPILGGGHPLGQIVPKRSSQFSHFHSFPHWSLSPPWGLLQGPHRDQLSQPNPQNAGGVVQDLDQDSMGSLCPHHRWSVCCCPLFAWSIVWMLTSFCTESFAPFFPKRQPVYVADDEGKRGTLIWLWEQPVHLPAKRWSWNQAFIVWRRICTLWLSALSRTQNTHWSEIWYLHYHWWSWWDFP